VGDSLTNAAVYKQSNADWTIRFACFWGKDFANSKQLEHSLFINHR
jgi:hypothetical protein